MGEQRSNAGESAREQHERFRGARLTRHQRKFGRLAPLTSRLEGETQAELAWRRGAEGEERFGRRLERLLRDSGVVVLHDLLVPGSRANVDHVCVGPGGVTIVDAKNYKGAVRAHRDQLWVGGRRRTKLIDGVHRQIEIVRSVLEADGLGDVDLRGALGWVNVDALPAFGRVTVEGVLVDGARPVAKLAKRRPKGEPLSVELASAILVARLGRRL